MKAIIIDDEEHCSAALRNDLKMFCPEVSVADVCNSAKEGMLSIRRHQPEVVFLDVEMPWMNGFELLEAIGEPTFRVIFTTAYDHFAARAFRISAADYLLKPIDSSDLVDAVKKLAQQPAAPLSNLLDNIHHPAGRQKVAVPTRDGYEFVPADSILYCQAEGSYTTLVLQDGRRLLLSRSLGEMEQALPEGLFIRIHHSHLANLNHISQFRKNDGAAVLMANGDELTVSKARRDVLLQRLGIRKIA